LGRIDGYVGIQIKRRATRRGNRRILTITRGAANDFVISQPKAWEGALARVTPEFEGWYLSPVFPTFRAIAERLEPKYLEWFCKRKSVWEVLQRKSRGMGARRETVSPDEFLSIEITLPSVAEQRRIVARIDEIAGKIREARTLRLSVEDELAKLLLGAFNRIADNAPRKRLKDFAPIIRRPVDVDLLASYPELGIRSFGKGTFHKPALSGLEVGSKRMYRIEPGDLLFSNVFAWEGGIAVAKREDSGRFGSHRFIACVTKAGVATSDFLCFYFLTAEGLEKIREASPGGAGRNRTLGLDALSQIDVPVPSFDKQK
jgi:type I restriction enzyme S subunit